MKTMSCFEQPFEISGLAVCEKGKLRRLPEEIIDCFSEGVSLHARKPAGAVLRFRTDSRQWVLHIALGEYSYNNTINPFARCGVDVYCDGGFQGFGIPARWGDKDYELTMTASDGHMHSYEIHLPQYAEVLDITVTFDERDTVLPPMPHRIKKPVLFYGSSITHGAGACRPSLSYACRLARKLDFELVNLGFSGSALGEAGLAEHIAGLDLAAFVYDYDHNAPNPEHLRETHCPFFETVRAAHPKLPILFVTRPDFYPDRLVNAERKRIVWDTYRAAVNAGDEKVWFVDGETFFAYNNPADFTVDNVHPNDAGHYRMATVIEPVLRQMLDFE